MIGCALCLFVMRPTPRPSTLEPTVLLTGFDAFGADRLAPEPVNASWLAVQAFNGSVVAGHRVCAEQLPTVFAQASAQLRRLLDAHRPALVVCVGQAGGRSGISLERVAVNRTVAHMPDNAGQQPRELAVDPGGPAAYFSTLPVHTLLRALHGQRLPAELSDSAGAFVCNHVFYTLMQVLASVPAHAGARGGFVHVPCLPSQGSPCLPLSTTVRALRVILQAAIGAARLK